MTQHTAVEPHWGIRFTGYLIIGAALWWWFAWRQFADPFVAAGIVTVINGAVSELVRLFWRKKSRVA